MIGYIQNILGIIIAGGFGLGLIPFWYIVTFPIIIVCLIIQIIISVLRFKLLNLILQIFVLVLALLSLIPFIGVVFRFLGLVITIIDISSSNSAHIVSFNTSGAQSFKKKKQPKEKKKVVKKKNFKDAEFSEK
jgi:glucan phosphoethanolaminetransferase (alkaline phosphatase superfamily)